MQQTYTAVVKRDGDWWIGWIEEVAGVNCQEASREALLDALREALSEALEFNRAEAREAADWYAAHSAMGTFHGTRGPIAAAAAPTSRPPTVPSGTAYV